MNIRHMTTREHRWLESPQCFAFGLGIGFAVGAAFTCAVMDWHGVATRVQWLFEGLR